MSKLPSWRTEENLLSAPKIRFVIFSNTPKKIRMADQNNEATASESENWCFLFCDEWKNQLDLNIRLKNNDGQPHQIELQIMAIKILSNHGLHASAALCHADTVQNFYKLPLVEAIKITLIKNRISVFFIIGKNHFLGKRVLADNITPLHFA